MNKIIEKGFQISCVFLFGVIIGVSLEQNTNTTRPEIMIIEQWKYGIPSVSELQEFLGVTPDGIIGPATMNAWTGHIFNKHVEQYFDPNQTIQ